jgi:hypothetical protein
MPVTGLSTRARVSQVRTEEGKVISSGPMQTVLMHPKWSDQTVASLAHSPPRRHNRTDVRPDALVHQIWVTDALVHTRAMSVCVLPRGSRPHMAQTNGAGAMLVIGWPHRLTFCCAARRFTQCCSIGSMLHHPTSVDATSMPVFRPLRRHLRSF